MARPKGSKTTKYEEIIPLMPPFGELPSKLRAIKDERRRKFAWNYVWNGGNASAAARDAGYSDHIGNERVRGHLALQDERVVEAIAELSRLYLHTLVPVAVVGLSRILRDPKHPRYLKSLEMVLDRGGCGVSADLNVKVEGSVEVNHTDTAIGHLRQLKALGVPREELEKLFGFSGLGRYEKMLEIADRRARTIEGTATEVSE